MGHANFNRRLFKHLRLPTLHVLAILWTNKGNNATWKSTLLDGHNRHDICTRRGLPFETATLILSLLFGRFVAA
jgi:hypothetical protein